MARIEILWAPYDVHQSYYCIGKMEIEMEEKYHVDANTIAADFCSSVLILHLVKMFSSAL